MASNDPSKSSNIVDTSPANSTPSTIISDRPSLNDNTGSPTPAPYKRRFLVDEPEIPLPLSPLSTRPTTNLKPTASKFRPSSNNLSPSSPTTCAAHPAYQHLYANDEAATAQFILNGEPLSYEHVKAQPAFVAAILTIEPGVPIDYEKLPGYIRSLRETQVYTPAYVGLEKYFDNLLGTHTYWLRSALEYYSYDIYVKMVHGLFLTRSDPALTYHVRNMSPGANDLFRRTTFHLSQDSFQEEMRRNLTHRRVRYDHFLHHLTHLKCTIDLPRNLRMLTKALVRHDYEKQRLAIKRGREHAEREARRRRVKVRMLENLTQQFGMLGTRNMDPQTEAVVLDVHEQSREEFIPSYTQEMWEDEVRERERQTEKYGFMRGFEEGTDGTERGWGYGWDKKSGVWFGGNRMDI